MSASVGPTTFIDDSLVLHLDAANINSYPGTGTVWKNINGTVADGNGTGSITYSTSNSGYFHIDGGVTYFDCLLGFTYNTTTMVNRTISAWYRCTAASAQIQGIIVIFDGAQNTQFEVTLSPAGTTIDTKNNQTTGTSGVAVALNTWYNVAATESHSGGITTLNLYLNGVLASTTSNSEVPYSYTANRVRLGCQKSGFPRTLRGDISNAHFYTRALTAAEVRQNFISTKRRFNL